MSMAASALKRTRMEDFCPCWCFAHSGDCSEGRRSSNRSVLSLSCAAQLQPNHLCNPIPWLCQPGSQLKPLELKLKPSEAGWGWPKPCLRPYPVRCGRCHQCSSLAAWMCACDPKPSVTSWIARSHGRLENALVEGFTCSKFYRLRLHLHDFDTWLALDDRFSTRKLSWVTAAV